MPNIEKGSKVLKATWRCKGHYFMKVLDSSGLAKVKQYTFEEIFVQVDKGCSPENALKACRVHLCYGHHVKPRNIIILEFKLIKKEVIPNETKTPSYHLLLPNRHKQNKGPTEY